MNANMSHDTTVSGKRSKNDREEHTLPSDADALNIVIVKVIQCYHGSITIDLQGRQEQRDVI